MWLYIFFLSVVVLALMHKQDRTGRRVGKLENSIKSLLDSVGTDNEDKPGKDKNTKVVPGGGIKPGETLEKSEAINKTNDAKIDAEDKNKPNPTMIGLVSQSLSKIGVLSDGQNQDSLPKNKPEIFTAEDNKEIKTNIDVDHSATARPEVELDEGKMTNAKKADIATTEQVVFEDKSKEWLLAGNIPARLGVVLSLLGFIALIKYGHTHGYFKITPAMGMFGLAVASMFTSLFGWIKRIEKPTFGRALQGGGVAALTLVIFASYRIYDLLSAEMSMILVALVTTWATIAALKQNSKWLAALGFLGGYLAPVALSNGSGNPVPLFSLYVILNIAVAIIAYRRDWRLLNMMGFLFTFIIGYGWANKYYKPELFSTVEPFILTFFLIYILIPLFDKIPMAGSSGDSDTGFNKEGGGISKRVSGFIVFGTPLLFAPIQMNMFGNSEQKRALQNLKNSPEEIKADHNVISNIILSTEANLKSEFGAFLNELGTNGAKSLFLISDNKSGYGSGSGPVTENQLKCNDKFFRQLIQSADNGFDEFFSLLSKNNIHGEDISKSAANYFFKKAVVYNELVGNHKLGLLGLNRNSDPSAFLISAKIEDFVGEQSNDYFSLKEEMLARMSEKYFYDNSALPSLSMPIVDLVPDGLEAIQFNEKFKILMDAYARNPACLLDERVVNELSLKQQSSNSADDSENYVDSSLYKFLGIFGIEKRRKLDNIEEDSKPSQQPKGFS